MFFYWFLLVLYSPTTNNPQLAPSRVHTEPFQSPNLILPSPLQMTWSDVSWIALYCRQVLCHTTLSCNIARNMGFFSLLLLLQLNFTWNQIESLKHFVMMYIYVYILQTPL